jgi:GTP 3',8-cyclase
VVVTVVVHTLSWQPLVRKDVVPLAKALHNLRLKELAITSNGVAPTSKFRDLVEAGVTHFNISLDTLRPERYAQITRRPAKTIDAVWASIETLLQQG